MIQDFTNFALLTQFWETGNPTQLDPKSQKFWSPNLEHGLYAWRTNHYDVIWQKVKKSPAEGGGEVLIFVFGWSHFLVLKFPIPHPKFIRFRAHPIPHPNRFRTPIFFPFFGCGIGWGAESVFETRVRNRINFGFGIGNFNTKNCNKWYTKSETSPPPHPEKFLDFFSFCHFRLNTRTNYSIVEKI